MLKKIAGKVSFISFSLAIKVKKSNVAPKQWWCLFMTCDISCFISAIKSLWMTSWSNKTWMTLKLFFHRKDTYENFFISTLVSLATWQLYIKVCLFSCIFFPSWRTLFPRSFHYLLLEKHIKIMSFCAL